ncbi:MAG: hypothetical protein LBU12_09340, partial [Deltaproteobacteria bacterium]|nr:hypothetical protein [Deltaproteobacteria bacterium]
MSESRHSDARFDDFSGDRRRASGFRPDVFDGRAAPEEGSPPAARPVVFEAFERPPAPARPEWLRQPAAPEAGTPSLEYLFAPFEPGRGAGREFVEDRRPQPVAAFDFESFDRRDTGVAVTLEQARAQAAQIVADARRRAEEHEAQAASGVRAKMEALEAELKAQVEARDAQARVQAEKDMEALMVQARERAQQAFQDAAGGAEETLRLKEQAAREAAEAAAALASVEARQALLADEGRALEEKLAALTAREAELDRREAEGGAQARAQGLAQGLEEGRVKGLAEGRRQGREEVLGRAAGFFKIVERVGDLWRELWRENAPQMIALAVEAAEAIVDKEIENGRGLAAGALSACVESLQKCRRAVFRVRPEDLAEIEAAGAGLRSQVGGSVDVEFRADPSLGPGDLIMESDAGRLDATIKTRRARIMEALRSALDQGLTSEPPEPRQPEGPSAAASSSAAPEIPAAPATRPPEPR